MRPKQPLSLGDGLRHPGPWHPLTELAVGVTLAALIVPLNIGYAQAVGLPPEIGLYAGLAPVIVFALTSSSRHLMIGPGASVAALLGAGLAPLAAPGTEHYVDLALATALLCGALFLVFGILRLGGLVRYLSKAVLVGFVGGLATAVLTGQLAVMLGVRVGGGGQRWVGTITDLVQELPDSQLHTAVVGFGTVALVLVLRHFWPAVPGSLVALVLFTMLCAHTGLGDGVARVPSFEGGAPSVGIPHVSRSEWVDLIPVALAISALGLAEGLMLARTYARRHGEAEDPDQDAGALGLANLAAGLTSAMPVGSSSSRTASVDAGGGTGQASALIGAGIVVIVILGFSDVIGKLPAAALAGIVAAALLSLVGVPELVELYRLRPAEFVIAVTTFAGVLVLGPLRAVVLAVIISAFDVVRRASHPPSGLLGPDTSQSDALMRYTRSGLPRMASLPGLVIYRFAGAMFYANADAMTGEVADIVASTAELEWFVLDAEAVVDIDPTAADALADIEAMVTAAGARFGVTRATEPTKHLLDHYGITPDEDMVFVSNRHAVAAYRALHAGRGSSAEAG